MPIRFEEPHIAELPEVVLGRPVEVIAKVFAALPALEVGCQQHFLVCLAIQLIKLSRVASYIQKAASLIDNAQPFAALVSE